MNSGCSHGGAPQGLLGAVATGLSRASVFRKSHQDSHRRIFAVSGHQPPQFSKKMAGRADLVCYCCVARCHFNPKNPQSGVLLTKPCSKTVQFRCFPHWQTGCWEAPCVPGEALPLRVALMPWRCENLNGHVVPFWGAG